jgi:beta-glucosidase
MYGLDAIHGNANVYGATIFPHNIGIGCGFDAALAKQRAEVTRREVLATGVDWVFGPNLSVARDKHWGRTYEAFSESTELVCQYAAPAISALQNDLNMASVIACAKHWIGDGGTQSGIDQGDTQLPFDELMNVHVPPYLEAIKAGVMTVMVSFSSWNGTKCHASDFLLTEVLKNRLGFEGFVVSDMQGIDFVSDDFYIAVERSVNAGIDMFMVPENWRAFIDHLKTHVEMGTVPMARVNDAVRRILSVKVASGLLDKPSPKNRMWSNHTSFGSKQHRDIARDSVRKSLVLLKNDNHTLPLNSASKVLVCGKNAHNIGHQCGGFTITWQGESGNETIKGTSIWQGIRAQNPNAQLVDASHINDINNGEFDYAIAVIGEKPYAEGMGDIRPKYKDIAELGSEIQGSINLMAPKGDTLELADLYPEDIELLNQLSQLNIPIITIVVSGRPLITNKEMALSDAFVAAWLPGSESEGIADVLFGEHDFSGRLAFSWPKQPRPALNFDEDGYEPLFPVGYGLTYKDQFEQQVSG